jgi:hypothetical protein
MWERQNAWPRPSECCREPDPGGGSPDEAAPLRVHSRRSCVQPILYRLLIRRRSQRGRRFFVPL